MAERDPLSAGGVEVRGVHKAFAQTLAVSDVSFSVQPGEVFVLLGPSGCGKSTLLRTIAGLERPTRGTVAIGGRDMGTVPVRRRGVGMVFQSYALFPHMSVADNVAYGLRMRGVAADERRRRVAEALELVELDAEAERYPAQLSGGQQQRVAIARALVIRPAVLLLDEPFGALDLKLRRLMQLQLRDVLRQVGTTAIHVTHDQEEAFTLGDRIGVMREGRLEQAGAGQEVYASPSTAFVASFLGDANLLPVERRDGRAQLVVGSARVPLERVTGSGDVACVRPERVTLSPAHDGGGIRGLVRSSVFLGDAVTYEVDCDGDVLRVRAPATSGSVATIAAGATVGVTVPRDLPLVAA